MQTQNKNSVIENNLTSILDFILDLAVIADGKGKILAVNQAFSEVTGLNAEDLIGKSLLEVDFFSKENIAKNLGKRICKRIIEAHDGNITVESVAGKGTTFTLTLPVEPVLQMEVKKT